MADGFISGWVTAAQSQLDGAAAGSFGAIVGASGTLISAMATLAIVMLGVNMVAQYRPMGAAQALGTVVKLVLIVWIGLKWDQFNAISSAIISGMDSLAASILSDFSPGGDSLASVCDALLNKVADASNQALDKLNWMTGAVLGSLITVGVGAVSALIALALVFASVMLTLYLGIAPIFIALSMFDATKDYFSKWLQGAVSYALYPVVIAGVLGGMVRVITGYADTISTGDAGASIAGFIPFVSILIIMGASVILIPMIVSGLSGYVQVSGPISPMVRTVAMATGAASMFRGSGGNTGGAGQSMAPAANTAAPAGASAAPGGGSRSLAVRMADRARKYDTK